MTADRHDIKDQLSRFQSFVALAREMGAKGVRGGEAVVIGSGSKRSVVVLFAHDDFPGTRFGYRCKTPADDRHEMIWLTEELASGGLHRIMRNDLPTPDKRGIIWTCLDGQVLRLSGSAARPTPSAG